MDAPFSSILWQNEDKTVTLLDIPRSIAAAQGTQDQPCFDTLRSTVPMNQPFATNEPKSVIARSKLQGNADEEKLQHEYQRTLQHAVELLNLNHDGPWCLSRSFVTAEQEQYHKTRKRSERIEVPMLPEHGSVPAHAASHTISPLATDGAMLCLQAVHAMCSHCNDNGQKFCCNLPTRHSILQDLSDNSLDGSDISRYRIPPHASFYLGNCSDSRSFHAAIRNQAQVHETRRRFDFMLFDPPWPNSSVKRTHKTPGTSYFTSPTLKDTMKLILGTDLDMIMADDCLVGFWITNKPAVRQSLLGENGIFALWSLKLEEEWVWLKTTAYGEPVTPLESVWRKPYEILLLGRRTKIHTDLSSSGRFDDVPKRRVIIGVPDVHSRKPCLRILIEPLLPSLAGYRALEVFARNLVAGWWSWGDECVKFNEEDHWQNQVEQTDSGYNGGNSASSGGR